MSNSLNFSNLTETEYYRSDENSEHCVLNCNIYYYTQSIDYNYRYLLIRFISPVVEKADFRHQKYSPAEAIKLYRSWKFRGYDFII